MSSYNPQQAQGQQRPLQRLPDPTADIVPIVAKGALRLAKRHPITSSLWIAGLITLTFFRGFTVPDAQLQQYQKVANTIDHAKLGRLHQDMWIAEDNFRQSKGWFSCDHVCQRNKRTWNDAKAKVHKLEKEQEKLQRKANSILGIFSSYGVEECKQLFWRSFSWGKKFGQRQTMFDMLFLGFRAMGRDESMIEYLFSILVHFLINMSLGMVSALVGFTFSLWGFIRSYSPDFMTALFFFAGAVISAAAMVATYLTLLYGTAGATVVLGVKAIVASTNRLEQQQQGGPPRNLHYE